MQYRVLIVMKSFGEVTIIVFMECRLIFGMTIMFNNIQFVM